MPYSSSNPEVNNSLEGGGTPYVEMLDIEMLDVGVDQPGPQESSAGQEDVSDDMD